MTGGVAEVFVLGQREIVNGFTAQVEEVVDGECLPPARFRFYLFVWLPTPPLHSLHLYTTPTTSQTPLSICSDTLAHLDPIHIPVLWRWMITVRALLWSTTNVGFLSYSQIKVELNPPFIRRLMISTDPAQKLTFLPLLNEVRQKEKFAIENKPPEGYYWPCGQVLTMCSSEVQKKWSRLICALYQHTGEISNTISSLLFQKNSLHGFLQLGEGYWVLTTQSNSAVSSRAPKHAHSGSEQHWNQQCRKLKADFFWSIPSRAWVLQRLTPFPLSKPH